MKQDKSSRINRKEQIVTEATKLFSRSGYDKVSTKELASCCGFSEAALYRYYKSKEEIYSAVLTNLKAHLDCEKLFASLEQETDIEIILKNLAQYIIKFGRKNKDVYRLLLYSTLESHIQASEVFHSIRGIFVEFLIKRFDELKEQGLIRDVNSQITARCFTGMVFDCALTNTLWKGYNKGHFKPAEVIANNIPIYARGLKLEIKKEKN